MESDQEMSNSASASTDIVLNSIEHKSAERAIWIKCFLNGNPYFPGERVLYSQRRFKTEDAFLDEITRKLHSEKSVRALSTPKRGTRIHSLFDLEDGQQYVALTNDTFKRLSYTDIETTPRRRPPVNYLDIPKKNSKFRDVSGKIHKTPTQAVNIKVWANKKVFNRPRVVTIGQKSLGDMGKVLECINDMKCIKEELGGCCVRLHSRGGTHINDPKLLHQDEGYVAVRQHDRFCMGHYTDATARNFRTSPKIEKLPPLNISRGSKNGKQWSPDHSHSSYPTSENSYSHRYKKHQNNRQQREHREEDNVFPRKPVTHKRAADRKKGREVDYDKDDGGVFKAKQTNRQTYGAREVGETRDTRVDLPIDQVPAEEVKDERIRGKPNSHNNHNNNNRTPPKHTSKDYSRMNGYDDDERLSSPQRHSTPPGYDTPRRSPTPRQQSRDHFSPVRSPDGVGDSREEEEAALKIQSHFRGHQVRKELNKDEDYKDEDYKDPDPRDDSDDRRDQDSHRDDLDLLQHEREAAATKIQAHYRGYQTRKNKYERKVNSVMSAGRKSVASQSSQRRNSDHGRQVAAATTIQAGYRGYRDRKMLKGTR
ncbi:doublecortin domain-containing protein 2-like isoform X4 [Haliotis rufescens]|uniref:doublecortin domain-containing protein 2-like isoform X4 n=1 Tax=Haliotis rufescens TaxID=6454 RepID=UPI00201F1D9F|nr:doublecortin domain-containing protein 2-like isoform X4 [Haliotis rufescens]